MSDEWNDWYTRVRDNVNKALFIGEDKAVKDDSKEDKEEEKVDEITEHDKLKEFFWKKREGNNRCECGVGHVDAGKHSDYCPLYHLWSNK